MEAEDLKKKLTSTFTLESDLAGEVEKRKLSLFNAQVLKKQYMKNKWWEFPTLSNLQSAYDEVKHEVEAKKRQKKEEQGK